MTRAKKTNTAHRAVEYLLHHNFKLHWDYDPANPPPEDVRQLLKPYFELGDVEKMTTMLLTGYLVDAVRLDHVPKEEWSRSARGHVPRFHPPTCRLVRCDEE